MNTVAGRLFDTALDETPLVHFARELEVVVKERVTGRPVEGARVASLTELDRRDVEPEDLVKYGLIPEFIGRLPVVATLDELDEDSLVQILTEPKNSLVKQYGKFFEMDGVELLITSDALRAIAEQAMGRGTGARGLRAIMEEVLLDTMYELPARTDVAQVVIDEQVVRDRVNPTLVPISDLASTDLPEERSA